MDFSQLNKRRSNSFAEQRRLIKRVLMGQQVNCEKCRKPLAFKEAQDNQLSLTCPNGCTDLLLDR